MNSAGTEIADRPVTAEETLQEITENQTVRTGKTALIADLTDEILADKARDGSEAAFAELVKRYMRKSTSIALQIVGDYEAARDLSQDVFIKIYNSLDSYKTGRKFFSWYYRILLNHCINFTRRKKIVSMLRFNDVFAGHEEAPDNSSMSIDETDRNSHVSAVVRGAVDKLSAKHKQIVVLCELEGFSQEEASDILGISVGTVRSRLHYARNNLKKYLKNYY